MVGRQQVEQTAIFADDAADEELRFFHERRAKRLVEREDDRVGRRRFDVAQVQPLPAKFEMSASDRSSASMRCTCCCSTTGFLSLPFSARSSS
jgi:hypothetical protein